MGKMNSWLFMFFFVCAKYVISYNNDLHLWIYIYVHVIMLQEKL